MREPAHIRLEERAQIALGYFNQGFNCAQSVFAAFHQEMGLSESEALRIASSMGGGIGGLREVCGAFSGLSLALGALIPAGVLVYGVALWRMRIGGREELAALGEKFKAKLGRLTGR